MAFNKKRWVDIFVLLALLCLSPIFFYKLGQSSLVSWDEAWYASIARNIITTGDFLKLFWNGKPFFDHPVGGFWWMAMSFKIFGVSDFSARFASALFGILTLVFVYFLGKKLFNPWVGFASALALSSAPWFLYRARSGNLDIFLTFFFVASILLAILSLENKKYFVVLGVSLALLFLTKTAVPLVITFPLIIVFFGKKVQVRELKRAAVPFAILAGGWFIAQLTFGFTFIERYFRIGLPGVFVRNSYLDNLILMKDYIHAGIGKWFWPGVAVVFGSLVLRKRSFYVLSALCLAFAAPFVFSSKGQIWHYIPIYPFLLLSLFGLGFWVIEKSFRSKYLAGAAIILISVYFSYPQVKRSWYEFIDIPAYVSDEAILSKEASKYPERLVVDGDFVPAAVFYSDKDNVIQSHRGELKGLFATGDDFLLITNQFRLDEEEIPGRSYEIIKSDRDKILIRKI